MSIRNGLRKASPSSREAKRRPSRLKAVRDQPVGIRAALVGDPPSVVGQLDGSRFRGPETGAFLDCAVPMRRLRAVFFFQAEDGIRDYKVTGVQTCALPI